MGWPAHRRVPGEPLVPRELHFLVFVGSTLHSCDTSPSTGWSSGECQKEIAVHDWQTQWRTGAGWIQASPPVKREVGR